MRGNLKFTWCSDWAAEGDPGVVHQAVEAALVLEDLGDGGLALLGADHVQGDGLDGQALGGLTQGVGGVWVAQAGVDGVTGAGGGDRGEQAKA